MSSNPMAPSGHMERSVSGRGPEVPTDLDALHRSLMAQTLPLHVTSDKETPVLPAVASPALSSSRDTATSHTDVEVASTQTAHSVPSPGAEELYASLMAQVSSDRLPRTTSPAPKLVAPSPAVPPDVPPAAFSGGVSEDQLYTELLALSTSPPKKVRRVTQASPPSAAESLSSSAAPRPRRTVTVGSLCRPRSPRRA